MRYFVAPIKAYRQSVKTRFITRGLAVLLIAMSIGQLLSFTTFVEIVDLYAIGNPLFFAVLLIALQLGAVPALLTLNLSPLMSTMSRYSILLAPIVWSVLASQALVRGLEIDNCGCFGAYFSQPLSNSVIFQDVIFCAWGIYSFYMTSYKRHT